MKLDDVYQIVKLDSQESVNKLLEHGWKLLKIDTYSSTDDRYLERGVFQNSHPYFILGATKEIYYSYPPTMISEHHYFQALTCNKGCCLYRQWPFVFLGKAIRCFGKH